MNATDPPDYPLTRECPYRAPAGSAALHAAGPLQRVRLYDGRTTWLITGPAEVRALLSDKRMSSRSDFPDYPVLDERHLHMRGTREMAKEEEGGFAGALFGVDPPEHTRQRQMLIPHFTARRISVHRDEIQRIVDERIDAMLAQGPPVDLMPAFAAPIPMMVICAFLGIPYEDREYFEKPARDLFDPDRADAAMTELTGYLTDLAGERRADLRDGLLTDLLDSPVANGKMLIDELVQFAFAILVAGTVTSTSAIALGILALLDTPGQYDALRTDPHLIPGAVDEILRHTSLVEQLARVATADVEVGGQVIREGDGLLVSFAGANLDPSVTSHPGEFDVTRPPDHHFAFGYGLHRCLGHNLAQLELEIVFRSLTERLPALRPAVPVAEIPAFNDATVQRLLAFSVTW